MSLARSAENVQVYVRVRPPNDRELQLGYRSVLELDEQASTVSVSSKPESAVFTYDRVAGIDSTQEDVFLYVGKPITDTCLAGYNGTIFAYGQTGSGKTHTIQGAHGPDSEPAQRGMMPRVFNYLFAEIAREEQESGGRVKYSVTASFLEIYNERIYDLLEPNSQSLSIREDLKQGVFVDNLREVAVTSANEICKIMETGILNRRVGETAMNRESSRSHSLFRLSLQSTETKAGLTKTRNSQFNMIDLAGSERQKSTATAGKQLKEASGINKSLSALGNVIMALVAESRTGKPGHVNYRDSKLTFLLRDALGGNSLTYIIACVSSAPDAFAETLSTLKFAQRAKQIKNRAVVNEDQTGSQEALQTEIAHLKTIIRTLTAAQHVNSRRVSVSGCPTPFEEFIATPVKEFQEHVWGHGQSQESAMEDRYEIEKLWQDSNKELQSKVAGLESLLKKHENQHLSNKMILKLRESALAKLEARLRGETFETVPELLCSELDRHRQENKILREQLEVNPVIVAYLMEIKELKAKLKQAEHQGFSHQRRLELSQEVLDLRAANTKLSAEVKSPRKLLEAMSTPQKRAFESFELQRWQREQDFDKRLKTLNEELTGAKEEAIAYKAFMDEFELEKDAALREGQQANSALHEHQLFIEELRSQHQRELTQLNEQYQEARAQLERESVQARQLEAHRASLETQLSSLSASREALLSELEGFKSLCSQLQDAREEADDAQAKLEALSKSCDGLQARLSQSIQQEGSTRGEAERLEQALHTSQCQLAELGSKQELTVTALQAAQQALVDTDTTIQELRNAVNCESRQVARLAEENKAFLEQVAAVQAELRDSRAVVQELQQQMELQKISEQVTMQELNEAKRQLCEKEEIGEKLLARLQAQQDEMQAKEARAVEEVARVKSQHIAAEQELAEARKAVQTAQEATQQANEETQLGQAAISQLHVLLGKTEEHARTQRNDLRAQVATLEQANVQAKLALEQSKVELEEERRAQVTSLEERLISAHEKLKATKNELATSASIIRQLEEAQFLKHTQFLTLQAQESELEQANKHLASQLTESVGKEMELRSREVEAEAAFRSELAKQAAELARLEGCNLQLAQQRKASADAKQCLEADLGRCQEEKERALQHAAALCHQLEQVRETNERLQEREQALESVVAQQREEYAGMVGHANHAQKIHHFQKVKHENDDLRARNLALEQLMKRCKCSQDKENAVPDDSLNKKRSREAPAPAKTVSSAWKKQAHSIWKKQDAAPAKSAVSPPPFPLLRRLDSRSTSRSPSRSPRKALVADAVGEVRAAPEELRQSVQFVDRASTQPPNSERTAGTDGCDVVTVSK